MLYHKIYSDRTKHKTKIQYSWHYKVSFCWKRWEYAKSCACVWRRRLTTSYGTDNSQWKYHMLQKSKANKTCIISLLNTLFVVTALQKTLAINLYINFFWKYITYRNILSTNLFFSNCSTLMTHSPKCFFLHFISLWVYAEWKEEAKLKKEWLHIFSEKCWD